MNNKIVITKPCQFSNEQGINKKELTMIIRPTIKPLPYYTVAGNIDYSELARSLRMEFVPKLGRRLPWHHLRGFRQDTIISFVKKHKAKYPYFMRTDITKFYPSVRHQDLVVGCQIAYRELLGLDYVPKAFKKRYLGPLCNWTKSLPLHQGIPLGSPLSAILAPLMLVAMWLELKRRFRVPFIVYMDDVLVLCEDSHQCAEIYAFLDNYLSFNYALSWNVNKTASGQFSRTSMSFCGWQFSGGYVSIAKEKVEAFKTRFRETVKNCKEKDTAAFLKIINRKIDGFGNYYKHGDVAKLFKDLDAFVRIEVRLWLKRENKSAYSGNEALYKMGLHSLQLCYDKVHKAEPRRQCTPKVFTHKGTGARQIEVAGSEQLLESIAEIATKLTEVIALQRRQLRAVEMAYL